jgi:hypothetical protein
MIIKQVDDKQSQIEILKSLLNHPNADTNTKKRIDQEIRNIQAGIRGENEASYEMKVHYGESKNWMILNDLRIEHGDLAAQIDHLVINRLLEMWVCESKHFSEGIAINEYSEFSAFFGNKPYGVPSPIEQNNKHILILNRIFDSGDINLPKRLGFTIKPDLKSLVLVSKKARITRPKAKIKGLECIIKNDQFFQTVDKGFGATNNPLLMARVVGQDTLEELAREIVKLHKPITFDWAAKFGLPDFVPAATFSGYIPQPPKHDVNQTAESASAIKTESDSREVPPAKKVPKPKKKLICDSCGVPVAYNVAKFCWFNKKKFGENIYCMDCQKKI